MTHSPDQPRPELSRFSGEFLSGPPASDQPRTGAGDAINTPARGTRAIVDCIAEYDLMGNEPARVEAAHVELDALVQENMTLRTRLEEAEARVEYADRVFGFFRTIPCITALLDEENDGCGCMACESIRYWNTFHATPSKEQDHD